VANVAVIGAQWGDEGKGKIVDLLTPRAWFTFEAGEMTLAGVQPGMDTATAVEGFSWKVPHADQVVELAPPTGEELAALQRWHAMEGTT